MEIKEILEAYKEGRLSLEETENYFKREPF